MAGTPDILQRDYCPDDLAPLLDAAGDARGAIMGGNAARVHSPKAQIGA